MTVTRAIMPRLFSEIDYRNLGYFTEDDLKRYLKQ